MSYKSCDQCRDCTLVANLGNTIWWFFWAKSVALVAITSSNQQARYVLYIHLVVAKITGRWVKRASRFDMDRI